MASLGEIIKEYRFSATPKISLDEFANRSGISKSYLSMLENNKFPRGKKVKPTVDTVYKVATSMGITFDDLINRLDDDYPIVINKNEESHITPDDEELKKAMALFRNYENAPEQIRETIDMLLKSSQQLPESQERTHNTE